MPYFLVFMSIRTSFVSRLVPGFSYPFASRPVYLSLLLLSLLTVVMQLAVPQQVVAQAVTTFAGTNTGAWMDGTGTGAQFNQPSSIAIDAGGNFYIADKQNNRIRKISSGGVVTTFAGDGTAAWLDASGTSARFSQPSGIAVDGAGNVYVADYGNHRIRKISSGGVVTTLAGGAPGFADGTGGSAQFQFPSGVTVDGAGNVYVADFFNHRIRKVTAGGVVTTLAGTGAAGSTDGAGGTAQFNLPTAIAVNAAGTILYVADQNNHRIRTVDATTGLTATLAGNGSGYADGTGTAALFTSPAGISVNGAGNILVAESGGNRIRVITPGGVVTTLAGSGAAGFLDATGTMAQFSSPAGLVMDGSGNTFVADQSNHRIRQIAPAPVPTITSFVPTSAGAATVVTITGTNFTGASAVSFGGVAAASFTVVNATTINATVAVGSASGNVAVTTAGGTATLAGFTFIPAPTIGSFAPTSAGAGTTVTIMGTGFTGATAVSFGGIPAASFMVMSPTTITAVVAAGGATGNVVVTTPGGTANLAGFTFIPAPTISSFTPTNGPGGTLVTISGNNFTGATAVNFGGMAAAGFTVVNPMTITATVAAGGSTGLISVTTPGGTGNSGSNFTFLAPPTVTGFTPTSAGPTMVVTITGTNFTGATQVQFGGVNATGFTVVSAMQITATVAAGGATGSVSVTTPNGTGTLAGFTFVPAPTISSFTPTSGVVGTAITIMGTNFVAPATVTIGGVPATSVMVISATQITANVGAGASGNVAVTTPGGTATLAGFVYPAPTITGFAPTNGPSGTVVTITGTDFTGATQVRFGGVNATGFTVVNNTTITATIGAGGTTGPVRVVTPGGLVNSVPTFTFLPPAPTVTSFSPANGGNTTVVTINGTNFVNVTGVDFGGTAATGFTVISPTQISATVGAGATGVITVTTLSGSGSSLTNFTWFPLPTVTSFTPMTGTMGAVVTITGTGFTGATQVRFGGTPAASFNVDSPTQITATVNVGTTGPVSVQTPGGTGNSAMNFMYTAPMPVITGFTPVNGGNTTVVTITGSNFLGATAVSFGGTPATGFTVVSATTITATVAGGATGSVAVTTPGGTATLGGFTWFPVPTITSFTPTSAGATTVVAITGTGFTGATQVRFGGVVSGSFTVVSPTQITAVVPSGAVSGNVQVVTPGGTATLGGYTFVPAPGITSFTPTSGGAGTVITINGTNLSGASAVTFGGTAAAMINSVSATVVTATVGAGATGAVSLTNAGGTATLAGFTFVAAPTITSFTPMAGISGTTITINGTNFTGVTAVSFGGVPAASFTFISPTQITAVVGAGANGSVSVTTPGGTATLGGFIHSFMAPSITGFAPMSAGAGTTVTITGTNFTGATQVQFGGVNAASYTVVSATQITAVVGAGGATGSITVTTPGGLATQAGFTFLPPPNVTSFVPVTGGLGNAITITGMNFTGTTTVTIGGTPVSSFTVISPTQINAVIGTGATGSVQVLSPGGSGTLAGFTYTHFTPTITSFAPTSQGGGNTVTINGTNFTGVTGVSFGGIPAMSFSTVSPTQVTAVVGAAGASGNVQITTLGGMATLGGFTFIPAPVITSFTPTSCGAGQTVTITGNNFTGSTQVQFGGVNAATFTVISPTVITATVGAGATGAVTVTSAFGTGTLAGFTFLLAPNPTTLAPTSAAAGQMVTITGTNFTGVTQVQFGGVNAASFTVVSATQINAVVAAGGATGNVSVTGPGGTGNVAGFTFIAPPTISSFAPTSAGGGATVLINGSNFTGATAVSFGGVPAASYTVLTANLISATLAAGGATGSVQVTTPGGTVSSAGFTFLPGPTITGFTPTSAGPTMSVVITGSGFTGAFAVNFGGTPATSFTVVSPTQINAVVAGGASGSVQVITPGGSHSLAGFTWVPAPVITSFMPINAAPGATVTINGMNFTGATQVRFGGTPATGTPASSFSVVSSTQITAVVAAGSTTGAISVTTAGGSAILAGFTYLAPPPTISSFTPNTVGTGMAVTINGTFLSGATAVTFGGTPAASYTVMSDNQIVAIVGAGSSGSVQVTTPGGSVSSPGFTYAGAPTITSFSPITAASGATVAINGTNFTTANAVQFGGVPAASFTVVSPILINAVVPSNASTGSLSVTTSGGTASLAGFTFIAPPTISGFTPTSAGPTLTVTINGANFTGTSVVSFGGTPAFSFTVISPTQILAVVAAGASGVVSVTTPGGVGSRAGFTFVPAPTVTSFMPSATGTGTSVTITGTNFTGATQVYFGGVVATSFSVNSPTQITAVVGTGSTGSVSVQTAGGTGATVGFTFVNNPTITMFAPMQGEPGTVVTLTGTNFTGATAVSFGGRPAAMFTVVSATQITVVVPGNAGGEIIVTTPGGSASITGFSYLPAPRITSFTPTTASGGQTIGINGVNFTGVTEVLIAGFPARFTVMSPSLIVATVPTECSNGTISVTSPEGTGTLAGFTFIYPAPTVTSFTPTTAGPNMSVSITGTGFLNVSAVSFGGMPVTRFTVVSSREITAIVNATGATGSVLVQTPGGTASLNGFTFVPAPTITSITPPSAIVGTTVTITGTNLAGVTTVTFGGVPAMFTLVSPTEIRAVVPIGGAVAVTTPGGTVVSSAFTTIPPPVILSFSPVRSGSNATITILGFNFTGASRVSLGNVPAASFRVVSPTQITAVVSTGATGSVSVTTTAGTISFAGYTFVLPPTITDISPKTAGSGQTVRITGSNLSTVERISFGSVTAASWSVVSDTRIDAVLGQGATGSVTLATVAGIASTSGFVYVPVPVVTGFSPTSGEVGTVLRITGQNFTGAQTLLFGGVPTTNFTVVSDSVITTTVGTNSSNGTISVVTAGGTGVSTQIFSFVAPPPRITSFQPTTAGQGMEVIVNGANFVEVRNVLFGGIPAMSFTVISPTQLTAIVAAGSSSGTIQVLTSTGNAEVGGFAFAPPPVITLFAPPSGGNGSTITIEGENFISVREIRFGGVAATSFEQTAPNRILAVVSTGATGEVSIATIGGTNSRAGFTFIPAPAITDFTPRNAGGRTTVTITGTNLLNASEVRFGGVLAIRHEVLSATRMTAVVAEGAKSGDVSVKTPGGTASLAGFTFLEPPTVTGFAPTTASPGTTITIQGTNFTTTATVSFGGILSPNVVVLSSTELRAIVPQGTTGGTVAVITAGGTGSLNGFNLLSPPRITSFTPVRASSGTVVTITGVNLTGLSEVRFGGVVAPSITFISDSEVRAVVGTGATGSVAVTASSGTATLAGFSYIAPPVITGFTPRSAGAGLLVTIIGANFTAASAVSFGGVPAARFTLVSPTQITAIVGAGATGDVSVTAQGGTGKTSGFTFLPVPVITSFTPSSGAVNTTLVISGRAFTGVSSVVLGNVSVPFTVNSDTQITVIIPLSGATTGNITVTSPGGVGISSQPFRYVPPPSITESSFVQSRQGLILRIVGNNFGSTQNVSIGQITVPFTVVNPTQVTASIPAGVTPTEVVTLVTQGGMARTVGMPILPAITNVSPSRGRAGTRVVVTGRNLSGVTQASIGGVAIVPTVLSSTQVTLTIPPDGASGVIGLTTPQGVLSTTTTFTLVTNAPLITSFTPTRGDGGTVIQLFGENFGTVNSVFIGGVAIPFRLISTIEMTLTIPRTGATSGNIVVSSPTGIASSSERFVFTPGGIDITPPLTAQGTVRTYPNPASETMTIAYNLSTPQIVTMRLMDMRGNILHIFPPTPKDAGEQTEIFNVRDLPIGTYLISLETPILRTQTVFTVVR